MRRLVLLSRLVLALVALSSTALADEAADALLERVADRAESLEDAAFLLTGHLIDSDGTRIALELEMQLLPGERAASAYVIQPDALADNIIVLDGDVVYNYTFLTHQVTLFDAGDPDAIGGLLGAEADEAEPVEVTFDLAELFSGYDASLTGSTDTPHGPADVIRLDNLEADATIVWVEAVVPESTGLPYRARLYRDDDDTLLAELVAEDLRTDVGLTHEEVTYIPEDAEVIDEREQ